VLYHLSHTTALFAFIIFQIGSHIYVLASLDCDPPTYASLHVWDDRSVPLHPAIDLDRVSWCTFCLAWAQIEILLLSAFQVAKIIGVSYHPQPSKRL
jgi:hypothetical protein